MAAGRSDLARYLAGDRGYGRFACLVFSSPTFARVRFDVRGRDARRAKVLI